EEDEDLSVQLVPVCREGDERKVDAVQHQLNGHENRDDVALDQKSGHTARKQDSTQHQVVRKGNHQFVTFFGGPPPSAVGLLASTTAPIMAIRIRIEVISKGSRYS